MSWARPFPRTGGVLRRTNEDYNGKMLIVKLIDYIGASRSNLIENSSQVLAKDTEHHHHSTQQK